MGRMGSSWNTGGQGLETLQSGTCAVFWVEVVEFRYGVATISRLLKIIGLFCRI